MKYGNILFDLDGVLTDNSEGITNGVRRVIEHFSLPPREQSDLLCFIGPPLVDSFRSFLGLSAEDAETGVRVYREYYRERGIFENVMYDGVPNMLSSLAEGSTRLFLATSKPEQFARRICERFGIAKYFTYIGGADLEGLRAKKSDVIRYVLDSQGLEADSCIMVGDRNYDALGAAECSLPCVGVLYGFGDRAELEAAGCIETVDSPLALSEYLLA